MRILLVTVLLSVILVGCATPTETGYYYRTADPNLVVGFLWAEAPPPLPPVEPEVVPEEEVGATEPDPVPAPPCAMVKGNVSRSGEKIFHVQGGANYDQVKIDEEAGEAFFCSEGEAVHAGFRKAKR